MNGNIDQAIRKTRRYLYDDGFKEIGVGILLALFAMFLVLRMQIPHDSPWFDAVNVGMPLLIMGSGFFGTALIKRLKERITYPRTGYVAFDRSRGWQGWFAIVIAAGIGLPMLIGYATHLYQPIISGVVFAIGCAFLGQYFTTQRFYALGIVSMLCGTVAALLNLSDILGMCFVLAGFGISMAISGGLALRRYLTQNPTPPEV